MRLMATFVGFVTIFRNTRSRPLLQANMFSKLWAKASRATRALADVGIFYFAKFSSILASINASLSLPSFSTPRGHANILSTSLPTISCAPSHTTTSLRTSGTTSAACLISRRKLGLSWNISTSASSNLRTAFPSISQNTSSRPSSTSSFLPPLRNVSSLCTLPFALTLPMKLSSLKTSRQLHLNLSP